MINDESSTNLRLQAEKILASRKDKPLPDQDIYRVLEELNIYQIELELQNENLIKMQGQLQTSHQKYADLYNFAPVAYFTLNNDGLIIDVNQSGLEMLGKKRNELLQRCFSRYIVPEHQLIFSQFRQGVLRQLSSQSCELKLLRWSGPAFDVVLDCKAIPEMNGTFSQFLICVTDISQRKAYEQSIHLQRSKMASIDRIRSMNEQIYSLAKNQNRSLTVMFNYIHGCIRRLQSEAYSADDLLQVMNKIHAQANELTNGINQVSNLSSKSVLRYEFVNINHTISDTLSLLRYEIYNFPMTIHYESIDTNTSIKADKLHIQQVLINLARNSIEAMMDAKTTEPKLLVSARLLNKNELAINMCDNGPGFNFADAEKLFEPHYTTKPYAMGLGLSTSRTIIEKHGGHLTANINSSGGANFQFTLPGYSSDLQ